MRSTSTSRASAAASLGSAGITKAKGSRRVLARRLTASAVRSQCSRFCDACSSTASDARSCVSTMSESRQVPPGQGAGKLAEARRGSYSDARPSSSSLLTSSGEAIRAEAVSDRIRTPPWLCAYARAGVHASKSAPVTIPVRPSVKSRAATCEPSALTAAVSAGSTLGSQGSV